MAKQKRSRSGATARELIGKIVKNSQKSTQRYDPKDPGANIFYIPLLVQNVISFIFARRMYPLITYEHEMIAG